MTMTRCWPAMIGVALAGLALAGCSFPGPLSEQQRDTLAGCRADVDRAYNTQNRYQLSERDNRDTPFSGGGQVAAPSDGLADQYSHETRVADCVHQNGVTEGAPPPTTTAPAAAPGSALAHTP